MSDVDTIKQQEEEDEKSNILPFRPRTITGGKDTTGDNWLARLEEGTVFLTRPRRGDASFFLLELHVKEQLEEGCTLLLENINTGETLFWVDTERYSAKMEPIAILGVEEKP